MKRILVGGVLLLMVIVAVGAFRSWQERQRVAASKAEIQKILAKDSGYMENVLGVEKNEGGLNFKEFFDLCDKAIDGKRTLTVELRGAALGLDPLFSEKARSFIDAGNEVIRAKRTFYQRQLELNSADSKEMKEVRTMHIPNVIDRVEAIQRYGGLVSKVSAVVEQMDRGATEYAAAFRKYAGLEGALVREWAEQGLALQGMAEQYQALNMKAVKASQERGSLIKAELTSAATTLSQAATMTPTDLPTGRVPLVPRLTGAMVMEGKTLYERRAMCYICHGWQGKGDVVGPSMRDLNPKPTDLTNYQGLRFKADDERFLVIKYGIPKTGMIPITKGLYDDDIWSLVAYIKYLSLKK